MMWPANNAGNMYGFQTYAKTPLMLSMLGGIVGDAEVQRAMSEYAKTWAFKHPSPWDYIFFMDKTLGRDLGWFWYYWLWTTESVDGSIANVSTSGTKTTVTVRQDGQMPSPVVLKVQFAESGPPIKPMANAKIVDDKTAILTWPVDVWFIGNRTFQATLDFGGRTIDRIVLDPRLPLSRPRSERQRVAEGRVASRHRSRPGPRRGLVLRSIAPAGDHAFDAPLTRRASPGPGRPVNSSQASRLQAVSAGHFLCSFPLAGRSLYSHGHEETCAFEEDRSARRAETRIDERHRSEGDNGPGDRRPGRRSRHRRAYAYGQRQARRRRRNRRH
jgi:hypothetical protein